MMAKTPTKPTASGTASVGPGSLIREAGHLSIRDVAYWIVKETAWRGKDAAKALAVAQCESGFNTTKRNLSSDEDSRGVWQINLKAHPAVTPAQAHDIHFSTRYAYQLWQGHGGTFAQAWVNCSQRPVTKAHTEAIEWALRATGGPAEAVASGAREIASDVGGLFSAIAAFVVRTLAVLGGSIIILIAIYMMWKDANATTAARTIGRELRSVVPHRKVAA